MKSTKFSLTNLNGKLTREEMKSVMGGVGGEVTITCSSNNTSLTCSCSNCNCSGSNDGSVQCSDASTSRVICDKVCPLP